MQEKPFFFTNNNYNLFGVLHLPEKTTIIGGFVFCHPFAEEKLWTHRVFVSFARELANLGFAVLRFDYMGHGDSDGEFEDSTVETRLADIDCAVNKLKTAVPDIKSISLLGMRFGGTLASLIAEERQDINKLVLWEPVVSGSRHMMEMLRSNLTSQLANYGKVTVKREDLIEQMKSGQTVNVDGYEISYKLFKQASAIDLAKNAPEFAGDVLIVQIGKEEQPIRKDLQDLADTCNNCDLHKAVEETFWREIKRYYGRAENLFDVTLSWMESKK